VFTVFLGTLAMMDVSSTPVSEGSPLGTPELLIEILMLIFVGAILFSLLQTVSTFGGQIGQALKLMALGIVFSSVEAIDRILSYFNLDYASALFGPQGMNLFHDIHKLFSLAFLAWGLSRLSKIYSSK